MDSDVWVGLATVGALVTGPLAGWVTARVSTRGARETAVIQTEPQQRRRDLEAFNTVTTRQDQALARMEDKLGRAEERVARMEQALDDQKQQCAEERREDRRVITSLARILRTVYRHMEALAVPDPVLDPEDVNVLEEYHIR
jgi:uncharacterized membrane-anchored protein YhcB (DUF1043 family)